MGDRLTPRNAENEIAPLLGRDPDTDEGGLAHREFVDLSLATPQDQVDPCHVVIPDGETHPADALASKADSVFSRRHWASGFETDVILPQHSGACFEHFTWRAGNCGGRPGGEIIGANRRKAR